MTNKPETDQRPLIYCKFKGKFKVIHKKKRFLSGTIRTETVQKLQLLNTSASAYRRLKADDLMSPGDCEPSHLPSANAIRIAKFNSLSATRITKDPLIALSIAKYTQPFDSAIKDIGFDKFFIHYWTSAQIHVYRTYCENSYCSRICIDATGGVVKKLVRPLNNKSGAIFLYDITVRDEQTCKQYSVSNMLSERHDSDSIHHWLSFWVRDGATIPNEIVVDMSIALLSGIVRTFTKCSSLVEYINSCYRLLFNNGSRNFTTCFIRCDVAHTIHLITKWNCLKDKNRRIRHFYIRSLAQVVQATDINYATKIIMALFTVALSETEGKEITNPENLTACEKQKLFLKGIISLGNDEENDDNVISRPMPSTNDDFVDYDVLFVTWGHFLEDEARSSITEGDRDNMQYLPSIIQSIIKLLKLLPLWSAVMLPHFNTSVGVTGSSAPVESTFNDIKNRIFEGKRLPLRVDEFVLHHIKSLSGTMKLAASTQNHIQPKSTSYETETSLIQCATCPACQIGNFPDVSSAHKCSICNVPIHNLDGCSQALPNSEEGFAQQRICIACVNKQKSVGFQEHRAENSIVQERLQVGEIEILMGQERLQVQTENSLGLERPQVHEIRNSIEQDRFEVREADYSIEKKTSKISSSLYMQSKITCPACTIGNFPDVSSAHKCNICNIPIHNLDGCSQALPNSEEGFGQQRICIACVRKQGSERLQVKEMRETENWMGQTLSKRPRSSYLQPNIEWSDIDLTRPTNVIPISIIKNGNSTKLKPVKIKNNKYIVANTCAIDSLLQILTSSYCDSPNFKNIFKVENVNSSIEGDESFCQNLFHNILCDLKTQVTVKTYRMRIIILKYLFKIQKLTKNINLISCECTITNLVDKLCQIGILEFSKKTEVKCTEMSCPNYEGKTLNSAIVASNSLNIKDFIIDHIKELQTKKCTQKIIATSSICPGVKHSRIFMNKCYLFIELSLSGHAPEIKLQNLQKDFTIENVLYSLRGVVGFSGGDLLQPNSIGHYVAYCLRPDNKWEIYDDTQDKKKNYLSQSVVVPHLIIYTI